MYVYLERFADLETPVTAYLKLTEGEPYSFLLESVEGGERHARYSFIGVGRRGGLVAKRGRVWRSGSLGQGSAEVADPLGLLYQAVRRGAPIPDGLPAFVGGAVGYTAYDLIRSYERLPDLQPDPLDLPDLEFFEPAALAIFDHLRHRLFLVCPADPGGEQQARSHLDQLASLLGRPLPEVPGSRPSPRSEFTSNFSRSDFESAVRRSLEYIRVGDVFQVVPSQRFSAPLRAHPFAIYRALRQINPSPHMGYLNFGGPAGVTLVASSPESLCRSDGTWVTTRPIAGTRPRGATPEEDLALERELMGDPKERAEHLMLVDLGRNDLGRVCRYGSIRVDEAFSVERYSHVMHLVSSVTGQLAPGRSPLDALASLMPMGTVSGAPKVRAMEILCEIEPSRRGAYGGSFGYIAQDGSMEMALTLRTLVITGGEVHIQAGAGLVADSDPPTEYQESLNKAAALIRAVARAEEGL